MGLDTVYRLGLEYGSILAQPPKKEEYFYTNESQICPFENTWNQ